MRHKRTVSFLNEPTRQPQLHIDQRDTWLGSQLEQWYNRDYTYDDNGCLTNETVARPEWNTNSAIHEYTIDYTYDYDSRLKTVVGGLPYENVEYSYDASGVRVARIAGVPPAAVTNYFVIDYTAPLKMPFAEADSGGNITRYYIWSSHGLLAHMDINPSTGAITATRYYHSDEQSSTLALTDEAGDVTDQFAYTPYGTATHAGSSDTPYQWLGGLAVRSEGNDLYYMLNRYYSAAQKRFISSDPSGIDGGVNLYAYGNLNPLAFIDPYGLEANQSSLVYGFAYHGSTVNPVTSDGGFVVGQNQITFFSSGETRDYVYGTFDRGGIGFDIGVAMESVAAWGGGDWSGDFDSVNVNIGPFSASYFWSPGGDGWRGVTFGIGVGASGIGYEGTTYYDMP